MFHDGKRQMGFKTRHDSAAEARCCNTSFCDLSTPAMNLESLMRGEQPQNAEGQQAV